MPGQPGGPGGPGSTGGGGGPPGGGPGGPMNRRMNAIKHANPLKDREAPTNRIGECHLTIFFCRDINDRLGRFASSSPAI